nr:PcfJ domain-containing protein [uncultured Porphyromonas sp.]
MKPTTRIQKEVAALSAKLRPITKAQRTWAFRNCFGHYVVAMKSGMNTCMECGHSWKSENQLADIVVNKVTCPKCGMELKVIQSLKRAFEESAYFAVVTTIRGWQVVRIYQLRMSLKKGYKAEYNCTEVVQRWLNAQGESLVMARIRTMNHYNVSWCLDSKMEIRYGKWYHEISPHEVYPRYSVLPEIKRNGFKGEYHDISPYRLFFLILTYDKAETLLKSGQYSLLRWLAEVGRNMDRYWRATCICIRNSYTIPNGSLWIDYIDMLTRLGKDTHNPKFVCPKDLKKAHDKAEVQLRRQRERESDEQLRQKAREDESLFKSIKGRFFGIAFTDGTIQVHVLESVYEHLTEGKALHHCVFTNKYYRSENSLILSARIDGRRIETIEVSLITMKVVQSRGLQNKNTEYHDRIVKLVEKNMHLINQAKQGLKVAG